MSSGSSSQRRADAAATSASDEAARGTDDPPDTAELDDVLAQDLPGLAVADVVVEGPAGVRRLETSVPPPRRPDSGSSSAAARPGRGRHDERRPRGGARPAANAPPARNT